MPDNSLLWGPVPCIVRCLAAYLSTLQMSVTLLPPTEQPKTSLHFDKSPLGTKLYPGSNHWSRYLCAYLSFFLPQDLAQYLLT